jgi:predicted PurR-regulated permease PerM
LNEVDRLSAIHDITGAPQARAESPGGRVTLAILLVAALYLSFLTVRPFIEPLLGGLVIAVAFDPLHERVKRRVRQPSAAALLSTTIILIAFLAPASLIVTAIVRQLTDAYQALVPGTAGETANRVWSAVEPPLRAVAAKLGMNGSDLLEEARSHLREAGTAVLGQGLGLLGAASGGVMKTLLAIMALYVSLRNGARMYHGVVAWSPLSIRHTETLLDSARQMVIASIWGVIAVAIAQGALCALGVWIAGLPLPLLWGLATAVVSVLPILGSTLVWLPAAAVLFAQGSIGWGIFMLVWGARLVGFIDNLVRPLVLSAKTPMHPLVTFVAILGGVQAFGLFGILAGPVILAVTLALFGILRDEIKGSHEPG